MNKQDFMVAFTVMQTPQEAFDAINNVRGWWGEGIEGETEKAGDEFIYRHKDMHYSKHRIMESIPGKRVVWQTMDSSLNFVENKNEWADTRIVFDISEQDGKTEVKFKHEGLIPKLECYNGCSGAWGMYVTKSLKHLIETGKGEPDPK